MNYIIQNLPESGFDYIVIIESESKFEKIVDKTVYKAVYAGYSPDKKLKEHGVVDAKDLTGRTLELNKVLEKT